MLCNECEKNNATVHITKIINGVKTETHLCEECAKKQQLFNNNFSMENLISGIINEAFDNKYLSTISCANCEMTLDEFRKKGKFGCANCINEFKKMLIPVIKSVQGYESHVGKIPKKSGGNLIIQRNIEELKYQLKKVIEQENYEEAAVIRDKIKELQNNIVQE